MGSKSYDSYGNMSYGGKKTPSQTDTKKYGDGYVPGGDFSSSGAMVKGSRLPSDGANRRTKRKRMSY